MFISQDIVNKNNLWEYYVKLLDFKAKCKFCEKKYSSINVSTFKRHMARNHQEIWKYEERRKLLRLPWIYFIYLNELHSHCIICNASVLSTFESVRNHLHSHSKEQWKNHSWPWKYFTNRDDFLVECNICQKNVLLSFPSCLRSHITKAHSDKIKKYAKHTRHN